MIKKLMIRFNENFTWKNNSSNTIKNYYQLTKDEKNAFWLLLENLLSFQDLEGKNKPSNIIDKYDVNTNSITQTEIINRNGLDFKVKNIWHYHMETELYHYNNKLMPDITKPILLKNLNGKTSDLLIHYQKKETDTDIIINICGLSQHKCWDCLYNKIN